MHCCKLLTGRMSIIIIMIYKYEQLLLNFSMYRHNFNLIVLLECLVLIWHPMLYVFYSLKKLFKTIIWHFKHLIDLQRSQKVKSEMAPNLKMNFGVYTNYVPSFMLLSQSAQTFLFLRLSSSTIGFSSCACAELHIEHMYSNCYITAGISAMYHITNAG